jgi:hypothetical protein
MAMVVLYIACSTLLGYQILLLLQRAFGLRHRQLLAEREPAWFFLLPSSFALGWMLSGWLAYMSAWLIPSTHPAATGGTITLCVMPVAAFLLRRHTDRSSSGNDQEWSWEYFLLALSVLSFALFLCCSTFAGSDGGWIISRPVWSDFIAHTAMVRSFSLGSNVPAEYPFFAGPGIHYHFLFYFACAVLESFGLPLEWSINLPSALCLSALLMVIAHISAMLSGKRTAAALAVFLFVFPGSLKFLDFFRTLPDFGPHSILQSLTGSPGFIGSAPYDDWGLWALNVYANQRHFA